MSRGTVFIGVMDPRVVREIEPPPTLPARTLSHIVPRRVELSSAVVDVVVADLTRDPRSEDYVPRDPTEAPETLRAPFPRDKDSGVRLVASRARRPAPGAKSAG